MPFRCDAFVRSHVRQVWSSGMDKGRSGNWKWKVRDKVYYVSQENVSQLR